MEMFCVGDSIASIEKLDTMPIQWVEPGTDKVTLWSSLDVNTDIMETFYVGDCIESLDNYNLCLYVAPDTD